ncbi:MAG: hypothetical protein MUF81_19820 [Verrucomicrobia bacterium]|jgi:hypothetical protein|nr:hypothetical protein [Verrucomicrobiota bacterium]
MKSAIRTIHPLAVATALAVVTAAGADAAACREGFGAAFTNAPWTDANFFPLAVWLQVPANAERYRQAGINTYVGLWNGPTEAQLTTLKKSGMKVICAQNEVSLRYLGDPTIIGWMHGDEPDNAQSFGARFGWSAPIPPGKVVGRYRQMRAADASRPVLLNLGQGVAWDGWYGRGTRNHHPEDYPEYLEGCDIASFDIYPAVHQSKEVAGNLWFVARGVERLVRWTEGKKPVWNCIEAARLDNVDGKPTPHEVRCEVWMSLIHGSRGIIYFVHQFKPKFVEAALLDDAGMLKAVAALNRQITELAPVLNSPTLRDAVTVQSTNAAVPVATMVKQHAGATFLFAVGMRHGTTMATFALKAIEDGEIVEVIGENRKLAILDGKFADRFDPWDVHLYRLESRCRAVEVRVSPRSFQE